MISDDKIKPMFRVTMQVVPAGAGRAFEHTINITAKNLAAAVKAAQPTVGYYSFTVTAVERNGSVVVP